MNQVNMNLFNPRKSALEILILILSYKTQLKKAKGNALFYDTKKAVTTFVMSFNSTIPFPRYTDNLICPNTVAYLCSCSFMFMQNSALEKRKKKGKKSEQEWLWKKR